MVTGPGRVLSFDEVTAWLREHHRAEAVPTYANAGRWYCSCGASNGPGTRLTMAQATANRDRHLRAMRRRAVAAPARTQTP